MKSLIKLAVLFVFVCAIQTQAQVFQIVEDHVKPHMLEQYDAAAKEYMAFLSANEYAYPVEVYRSRDLHYYYLSPMESTFAELDSIRIATSEVAQKDPDGWDKLFSQFNDTYNYSRTTVQYLSNSLSYIPENMASLDDETVCFQLWFVQVRLGQGPRFTELMKEFNALCSDYDVPYSFYTYMGLMGMDQGTYILSTPGKDPADIWEIHMKTLEMVGEEGRKINNQLLETLDKMEVKHIWWLKNLSYKPE